MGVRGQIHAPAALPPEKNPGTHWLGVRAQKPVWKFSIKE